MKNFIFTEGGKAIGFGHVTRCLSYYHAFKKRGINLDFVIHGDDSIKSVLRGTPYKRQNWLRNSGNFMNDIKNANVVIVDSYLAGKNFYEYISEHAATPVFLDDNQRLVYPSGFVVNGNSYASNLRYSRGNGTVYLLGAKYFPLRKEFRMSARMPCKGFPRSVLITLGGDDHRGLMPRIIRLLRQYAELKKIVIIGRGFRNISQIKASSDKSTEFIYYPAAKKMALAMRRSDLSISASGQTLYELAVMGVPIIGICTGDDQRRNLDYFEEKQCCLSAGYFGDKHLMTKITHCIDRLLSSSKIRKNLSRKAALLVDGLGTERVADEILSKRYQNRE